MNKVSVNFKEYVAKNQGSLSMKVFHICDAIGCTRSHLIRKFKEDFGITPHKYINNLKIEKSKKLMAAGYNVSESATLAGFKNIFHFSNVFKKIDGNNPKVYADSRKAEDIKESLRRIYIETRKADEDFENNVLTDRMTRENLKDCVNMVLSYNGKSIETLKRSVKRILR